MLYLTEPNNDSPLNTYAAALWSDQEGTSHPLCILHHTFASSEIGSYCALYYLGSIVSAQLHIDLTVLLLVAFPEFKKVMRKQYRDAGGVVR